MKGGNPWICSQSVRSEGDLGTSEFVAGVSREGSCVENFALNLRSSTPLGSWVSKVLLFPSPRTSVGKSMFHQVHTLQSQTQKWGLFKIYDFISCSCWVPSVEMWSYWLSTADHLGNNSIEVKKHTHLDNYLDLVLTYQTLFSFQKPFSNLQINPSAQWEEETKHAASTVRDTRGTFTRTAGGHMLWLLSPYWGNTPAHPQYGDRN